MRVIKTRIARPTLASQAAIVSRVMTDRVCVGDVCDRRIVRTNIVASRAKRLISSCFRANIRVNSVRNGRGVMMVRSESISLGQPHFRFKTQYSKELAKLW